MCTWSEESTKGIGKETWFNFDVYKEVVDEGVKKGLKAIRLNYINEPLIRPDLTKFIKYARTAGILDIYFSTNGSLLNEENSRALIESGLTRLQVSLDAATEQTYKKIRVSSFSLNEVTENIIRFIKIRNEEYDKELPLLRVNFVKTEMNLHELEDFVSFWSPRADGIGIQDLVNIIKPIKDQKTSDVKSFKCSQPFNHMAVRYNGHILPCCTFFGAELPIAKLKSLKNPDNKFSKKQNIGMRQTPLKNVTDSELVLRTIEEAWKSEEMEFLRDIHRKGEYWRHPVCKKCVESTSHMDKPKTIICDIDGTLIRHHGNLEKQITTEPELLPGTKERLDNWDRKGYKIILITGRRQSSREITEKQLSSMGIFYDILIMGVGGGTRVLINDLKPDREDLTALAYNIGRNKGLKNLEEF